jgi:hypothetical protein
MVRDIANPSDAQAPASVEHNGINLLTSTETDVPTGKSRVVQQADSKDVVIFKDPFEPLTRGKGIEQESHDPPAGLTTYVSPFVRPSVPDSRVGIAPDIAYKDSDDSLKKAIKEINKTYK